MHSPTPCPACGDPVEGAEYCELHDPGLRVGLQVIDLRAADFPVALVPPPQSSWRDSLVVMGVLGFYFALAIFL